MGTHLTLAHRHFQFGEWQVHPDTNSLVKDTLSRQLEPRAMDVLRCLCQRQGEVLSAEQLLASCWGGAAYGDNPVHKVITQLRKALDDSSAAPRYIETIRKRGYRTLATPVYDDHAVSGSWLHDSPFRGLHAFEEQHAAIFFGRKHATTQLVQSLRAQADAGCALMLVLGPSGSGKTSLVRAGVLPQLGLACHLTMDLADVDDGDLLQALGSVLLDAEMDGRLLFDHESAATLGARLRDHPAGVVARLQDALGGRRLGLFIDRLEAMFRLVPGAQEHGTLFIDTLVLLAQAGCVDVLLACRNDFYPHLAHYPALMALKLRGGHFDLNPPDMAEIGQIIRQPTLAAQLQFDVDPDSGLGLDEVLCSEARARPDMLPLLQYCLEELYRQRRPDGALPFAVFRALGGIEGAIGARAEEVTQALSAAQVAALPRVLSQLVIIAEDEMPVTSRRLPWSTLRDPAELELVKAMVEARLFVSELNAGVPAFGIAHDALLRRWPRVVAWIDSHRHALQLRTRISLQAARWQASGRSADYLLPRGIQANQARDLLQTPGFQFGTQDREFIDASLRVVKRGERRRVALFAAVAVLALLASVLGLLARASQQEADQHRIEAEGLMQFMLGEFVDKLRPLGRLDLLDSVSGRALSYLASTRAPDDNHTALTQRAKALQVLAEVKVARADPAGATQALLAARQILQAQSRRAAPDKPLLKALGENAYWLGVIAVDQRNLPEAERYLTAYLSYSDRLAALDPADIDGWLEQSYAHSNLGTVALRRGELRRAADAFAASINLKTRALSRSPERQDISMDLADSLSWLASAREKLGQLDGAMALYQREAALMQRLHQAGPNNAQWTERYALAMWHQAELQMVLGDIDAARQNFLAAEALLQDIIEQDPSNRVWQSTLYTVQLKLLDLQPEQGAPKIAALQALQGRLDGLIALEPKKWNLQRLRAMAAERRAAVYWAMARRDLARQQIADARTVLERLRLAAPDDMPTRATLADVVLLGAAFDLAEGKQAAARTACGDVQALLRPAALASTDFHVLAPWVRAARCLGAPATAAEAQLSKMQYQETHHASVMAFHPSRKETQ
jgi:DNA-binding winged helix-turn-helix (wHTH) protein/tetratricopeptide (TPR) repeat protein